MFVVVHAAAVVLQAVAYDEVIDVQQHVVHGDLVEHPLRKLHRGGFVFHNHDGLRRLVIQHAVASQALVASAKLHLVGHERRWIAFTVGKEMDEMLAHPFLRRQTDVAPPQGVENVRLAVTA